ncbi:hypothetical protein PI124_g20739 [Phytophthora idaei]|nr:hypothetical protein PI124_g20739 [Phytophthora idaei]
MHSATKLQAMWKDVHRAFSIAETRNRGYDNHLESWGYCRGKKSVIYQHLWCALRGTGCGFSPGCVYAEDEDDSTKETDKCAAPKPNKKRQKCEDPVIRFTEIVDKLIETETNTKCDLIA